MKVLLVHRNEVFDITGYHYRVRPVQYSDYPYVVEVEKKVASGETEVAYDQVWLYQGSYNECLEMFQRLLKHEMDGHKLFTIGCDGTTKRKETKQEVV